MRLSSEVLHRAGATRQPRPLHWAPLPVGAPARSPVGPQVSGGAGPEAVHQEVAQILARAQAEAEALLASARAEAEAGAIRLREQALADGREQGRAEVRAQAAGLLAEAAAIREQAEAERRAALDALVGDIAALAGDVARQVLQREIEQSPDDIVRLTRRLLQRIESPAVLRAHPTLSPVLEAEAGTLPRTVEVRPDPSVPPGGVVIESEEGVLDGSLEGRLARVTAPLGGDAADGQ